MYYYRPNPKAASCTDALAKPTGADFVADAVFAIALLTAPGTVVITSGYGAPVRVDVPAGATTVSAPMGVGAQTFVLERGGATVLSGTGTLEVSDACTVRLSAPLLLFPAAVLTSLIGRSTTLMFSSGRSFNAVERALDLDSRRICLLHYPSSYVRRLLVFISLLSMCCSTKPRLRELRGRDAPTAIRASARYSG